MAPERKDCQEVSSVDDKCDVKAELICHFIFVFADRDCTSKPTCTYCQQATAALLKSCTSSRRSCIGRRVAKRRLLPRLNAALQTVSNHLLFTSKCLRTIASRRGDNVLECVYDV